MSDTGRKRGTISLRQGLLLIFVLGSVGLGAELLLLEHFQEWRQQVPLVLLASGLVLVAARARYRRAGYRLLVPPHDAGVRAGRDRGILVSYRREHGFRIGNVFKVERLGPGVQDGARRLPVLAPGALIQLGLIGYLYTHRHPDPGAGRSGKY